MTIEIEDDLPVIEPKIDQETKDNQIEKNVELSANEVKRKEALAKDNLVGVFALIDPIPPPGSDLMSDEEFDKQSEEWLKSLKPSPQEG